MRFAIVAILALVCAVSNAEARQRHRVAHQNYALKCNVSMPCEGVGKPVVGAKNAGLAIGLCGGTAFATIAFHIWRHPS